MKLKHLEYFLAVVESKSFTLAAGKLGISQPSLSQQIRALEESLGTHLFDRLRSGIRLTNTGTILLKHAKQVIQSIDDAKTEIDNLAVDVTGKLRIGAVPSMNVQFVPTISAVFRENFPNVRLHIIERPSYTIEDRLTIGELDIGVALPSKRYDQITAELLFQEQVVLAFRSGHRLDGRRSIQISALRDLPMALYVYGTPLRDMIDRCFEEMNCTPNVAYEADTIESLISTVSRTDLCTLVPEGTVQKRPGIGHTKLQQSDLYREISILRNQEMYLSRAAQNWIDIAKSQARLLANPQAKSTRFYSR